MRYLLTIFLLFPAVLMAEKIQPEPYCKRLPFSKEEPPGIIGEYEVVGKDSETGRAYVGDLLISIEKNAYSLRKTVQGKNVLGSAWVEICSPDKFKIFVAQYQMGTNNETFSCYLSFDGDNFTRASCKSFNGQGLEAWYQRHDIKP